MNRWNWFHTLNEQKVPVKSESWKTTSGHRFFNFLPKPRSAPARHTFSRCAKLAQEKSVAGVAATDLKATREGGKKLNGDGSGSRKNNDSRGSARRTRRHRYDFASAEFQLSSEPENARAGA